MSKALIIFLGLLLLAILGYFCIYNASPKIQDDIDTRTHAALAEQGLSHVTINTDARHITLTGKVTSDTIKQQAEEYARNVYGVNVVENQLTTAEVELIIEPEPKLGPKPEPIVEQVEDVIQAPEPKPLPEITCQQDFDALLSSNQILFATNSANIDSLSHSLLSNLIEVANQCPNAKIEIGGHTDSSGSDDYNQRLSQARATSVMSYLINNGIKSNRLTAVGYGETSPVADNESYAGKAKNRRIEFNVKGTSQ